MCHLLGKYHQQKLYAACLAIRIRMIDRRSPIMALMNPSITPRTWRPQSVRLIRHEQVRLNPFGTGLQARVTSGLSQGENWVGPWNEWCPKHISETLALKAVWSRDIHELRTPTGSHRERIHLLLFRLLSGMYRESSRVKSPASRVAGAMRREGTAVSVARGVD